MLASGRVRQRTAAFTTERFLRSARAGTSLVCASCPFFIPLSFTGAQAPRPLAAGHGPGLKKPPATRRRHARDSRRSRMCDAGIGRCHTRATPFIGPMGTEPHASIFSWVPGGTRANYGPAGPMGSAKNAMRIAAPTSRMRAAMLDTDQPHLSRTFRKNLLCFPRYLRDTVGVSSCAVAGVR